MFAGLFMIIFLSILALLFVISLPFIYHNKRQNFILEYSNAINDLLEINKRYNFKTISSLNQKNVYDNENFYDEISPKDYLTYQLVFLKNKFKNAIADADNNKVMHTEYLTEVNNIDSFNSFDYISIDPLKFSKVDSILVHYWLGNGRNSLAKTESYIFKNKIIKPITDINIRVCLVLTKINGSYVDRKEEKFDKYQILEIIDLLDQRNGDFYLNNDIWQSICRVERGKVTNKIRFAVYNRDNNKCKKCGSTYNLEVDHIYPISKGGKSTFDNLQTLCHNCNILKSNTVEKDAINPKYRKQSLMEKCPYCNTTLIKKKGTYGFFYACPNYPKCRYTKNID